MRGISILATYVVAGLRFIFQYRLLAHSSFVMFYLRPFSRMAFHEETLLYRKGMLIHRVITEH